MRLFFMLMSFLISINISVKANSSSPLAQTAYATAYGALDTSHQVIAHQETLLASAGYAYSAYQISSWSAASTTLTDWCQAIIKEHGLARKIHIKINPAINALSGFAAFGNDTVIISHAKALEIEQAIQNSRSKEAQTTLEVSRTYLRHEIAHLKNSDTTKRLLANLFMSIITHTGSILLEGSQFLKKSSSLFGLLTYGAISWVTGKIKHFVHKKAVDAYCAHQEKNADDYAFATSKDPQELRSMAHYLEEKHGEILQLLTGKATINPSLQPDIQEAFAATKKILEERYRQEATAEPYEQWLKRQIEAVKVEELLFPGRPALLDTISDARRAAQRLEAQ